MRYGTKLAPPGLSHNGRAHCKIKMWRNRIHSFFLLPHHLSPWWMGNTQRAESSMQGCTWYLDWEWAKSPCSLPNNVPWHCLSSHYPAPPEDTPEHMPDWPSLCPCPEPHGDSGQQWSLGMNRELMAKHLSWGGREMREAPRVNWRLKPLVHVSSDFTHKTWTHWVHLRVLKPKCQVCLSVGLCKSDHPTWSQS